MNLLYFLQFLGKDYYIVNNNIGDYMLLYIIIFLAKVVENAVTTLRLIVVSNGKKIIGAILQGVGAVIWICVTGLVVTNILEDPGKIIAFALGSIVGSYLGCIIEEKIALGNTLLTVIVEERLEATISEKIRENNFAVTSTKGKGKEKERSILFIFLPRKKISLVLKMIKSIDNDALIISENAFRIYGGYLEK